MRSSASLSQMLELLATQRVRTKHLKWFFRTFQGPFRGVFSMTFQDPVQRVEILVFLTRSMQPHIVTEHCTSYYVILHLTYLSFFFSSPISSLLDLTKILHCLVISQRDHRKNCHTSYWQFHDFPGPKNVTFKVQDFPGSVPVTLNTTGRETPYFFLLTSGLEHGPWRHATANK